MRAVQKSMTMILSALSRLHEALDFARALQAHHRLVLGEEAAFEGEALAVAAMRPDRPQQDRLAAEERAHQGFAIAGAPEIFPGDRAPDRAAQQAPEDERERQVEPDQR